MRTLYILRGAPGSGKSTLLKQLGYEHYALNADTFRNIIQSPVLNEQGMLEISQTYGRKETWRMLMESLEKRMEQGAMIIVDATHSKTSDIHNYRPLADKYRYEMVVIDFTSIPLDVLKKRNEGREQYKQVPEKSIEKQCVRFKTERVPDYMRVINYKEAKAEFKRTKINLNAYKKIHHFGDIHGSYTVLMEYMKWGLKDDEFYIFAGDYLDRGIENAKVINYLISISQKPNVVFLEGNHEHHLIKWANNEESKSIIFETDTKIELQAHGVNRKDVRRFCKQLKECFHYQYGDKEVLVTHGGLPVFPENLKIIPAIQLIRGVGDYKTRIDDIYNEKEQAQNKYQVHGHRNIDLDLINMNGRSFNLEGAVEQGGHLRILTLDTEGFKPVYLTNTVYRNQKVM